MQTFTTKFTSSVLTLRRGQPSPPPSHGTIIKCETNWGEQTQVHAHPRRHSRALSFSPPPSPLPIPEYPGHPNSVHKPFTLSKSSKRLYFFTHGQRQRVTGSIKFEPAQGADENNDDVKVDVEAYSAQSGALGSLGICTLGDETGQGIGIYVCFFFTFTTKGLAPNAF